MPKQRKNLRADEVEFDEDDIIEIDEDVSPSELPSWYKQFIDLPEKTRKLIVSRAWDHLNETKPDTYEFLKGQRCKLVGVAPSVAYALCKEKDGDIDVTFIHSFSIPTLLFWHPAGEFAILVSANLKYDDSVLNKIRGNRHDKDIRGFTG